MDLMPTFLDCFGLATPDEVRGRSILPLLGADREQSEVGIFGMFGGPIGATDGRYTYFLYPKDLYAPGLHEYTLMPMHLSSLFSGAEMKTAKLAAPFDFTKGMPILRIDALKDARRIPTQDGKRFDPDVGTTLYDISVDPQQKRPFRDADDRAALPRRHRPRAAHARRAGRVLSSLRRAGRRRRRGFSSKTRQRTEEIMSSDPQRAHRAVLLAAALAAAVAAAAPRRRRSRSLDVGKQPPITILIASTPWYPAFEKVVELYEQQTGNQVKLDVDALRRHARKGAQRGAQRPEPVRPDDARHRSGRSSSTRAASSRR